MSYRLIDNETNEDIIDKLGRIKDERDKYKIALDKIKEYIENKLKFKITVDGKETEILGYNQPFNDILELLEEIE